MNELAQDFLFSTIKKVDLKDARIKIGFILAPPDTRGSVDDGFDYEITIEFGYEKVEKYYSKAFAPTDLGMNEARRARMDNDTDGQIWLRGDFHVHSIYSDGNYTPEEQVSNAIKQELDFFFFTEHNSHSGNDVMGVFAPEGDDLLIGRSMEVTSRYGHWNAIGMERDHTIEWRYKPGDQAYADAAEQVHRSGGIVSVNHPYMVSAHEGATKLTFIAPKLTAGAFGCELL